MTEIRCLGLFTKNNSCIEINNGDGNHVDKIHDGLRTNGCAPQNSNIFRT